MMHMMKYGYLVYAVEILLVGNRAAASLWLVDWCVDDSVYRIKAGTVLPDWAGNPGNGL